MTRLLRSFCLTLSLATLWAGVACADNAAVAPRMTAVWVEPGVQVEGAEVEITVSLEGAYPANAVIPVACKLSTDSFIGSVEVSAVVLDDTQTELFQAVQVMDLLSGASECLFSVDVGALPPGEFTLVLDLAYQDKVGESAYTVPFRKVDSDLMLAQLQDVEGRMAALLARQEPQDGMSYLRTRLILAQESLAEAKAMASQGHWRALNGQLGYLRYVVNSSYAGLAMGDTIKEQQEAVPFMDPRTLRMESGALLSGNRPVYLFGANLPSPSVEAIERLALFGFHFAVINITPEATRDAELFRALHDPVFEAAARHNIGVVVQLQGGGAGGEGSEAFLSHLKHALPYLKQKPAVLAVSLANAPRFQFQGAAVRNEFVRFAKERYPDRMDLNRAWRAHLASHDDIEIWGDFPDHAYQNRRSFQFDWQQFHQHLGTRFFTQTLGQMQALAPGLPLTATLPNSAFTQGESRQGVNRETLAGLVDFNACATTASAVDKFYSIAYPNQSVYYTLLRSIQPDKPIADLHFGIEFLPDMDSVWVRSYVQAVVWDAVMSGANAAAFTYDDALFGRADALDALNVAMLDINRLAPIIHAFDRAPRDVAVLFSRASKIFDDGHPHLDSAWYAFEGSSFGGYGVRFITESQIIAGGLANVKVLVLPETPAVADATFDAIGAYAQEGGNLIRVGTPIPYNEHGQSRRDTVRHTPHTVLVRGMNLPTEYLHAMDAMSDVGGLPNIPRAVNSFDYPVEGVKSRHVKLGDEDYLYLVNLRKEPVLVDLHGHMHSGRDLIRGRTLAFPRTIRPLDPMLIHLDRAQEAVALTAAAESNH